MSVFPFENTSLLGDESADLRQQLTNYFPMFANCALCIGSCFSRSYLNLKQSGLCLFKTPIARCPVASSG